MDRYDFSTQPPAPRDRIYVSWSEQWDLSRYVDDYLETRKLRTDEAARERVRRSIEAYKAEGALRKADMDYYLDANVRAELEIPQPMAARTGKRR